VDLGIVLQESTVKAIKEAVHTLANRPVDQLQNMARRAWEFARANHTRERFEKEYRKVIEHILNSSLDSSAQMGGSAEPVERR
jgi:hypothetical protein